MPHNWITKINESNSRIHKEDIVKQCLEAALLGSVEADQFLTLAWNAYNPYNVYHLTRIPITEFIIDQENNIDEFFDLIKDLRLRNITGNAAVTAVEWASCNYDSDLWNTLLRPTILKDLKIGATIRTFNKVCKGTKYEIPVFECQLATDSKKHPKKLVGKKILEPKLDGIRALAIVDKTFPDKITVQMYSRNGKPLDNFKNIEEQLASCLKLHTATGPWAENRIKKFVLDGEIISENFQALMKQAQRKTNVDTSDAVYTIFDVIPLDKFNAGSWNMIQSKRSNEWLGHLRDRVNNTCSSLHIISGIEVDLDTAEGHNIMNRFIEDQIEMGYEGSMLKDPDAPYSCKRGFAWLKHKPVITLDLTIVGFEPGKKGTRNEHRLGAIIMQGEDDGRLINVNVGGGYSDKQRDEIWLNRQSLIGHLAEVKADVVTQNQDGTYSLRFPRFERFRDIVAGEKI